MVTNPFPEAVAQEETDTNSIRIWLWLRSLNSLQFKMALPQLLHSPTPYYISHKHSLNPLRVRRRRTVTLRCSSRPDDSVELPLFPLNLVLFPGTILPLQIFEYRYRIMVNTVLESDLRFGVIYSDPSSGTASVGCVAEIARHERLSDDRFLITCKGQERFRVGGVVRTKPYLVARVSWLEDRPSGEDDLEALAEEVEASMKDVIRLSNRLNGKKGGAGAGREAQDLRRNLFPTPFSFYVGSTFEGVPREQQALLELEDTASRLKRERETLRDTLSYLSAVSAVKDVFPSSSS